MSERWITHFRTGYCSLERGVPIFYLLNLQCLQGIHIHFIMCYYQQIIKSKFHKKIGTSTPQPYSLSSILQDDRLNSLLLAGWWAGARQVQYFRMQISWPLGSGRNSIGNADFQYILEKMYHVIKSCWQKTPLILLSHFCRCCRSPVLFGQGILSIIFLPVWSIVFASPQQFPYRLIRVSDCFMTFFFQIGTHWYPDRVIKQSYSGSHDWWILMINWIFCLINHETHWLNQLRFCEGREVFDRIMEPGFPREVVVVDKGGLWKCWRPFKKAISHHFNRENDGKWWNMMENDGKWWNMMINQMTDQNSWRNPFMATSGFCEWETFGNGSKFETQGIADLNLFLNCRPIHHHHHHHHHHHDSLCISMISTRSPGDWPTPCSPRLRQGLIQESTTAEIVRQSASALLCFGEKPAGFYGDEQGLMIGKSHL